MTDNPTTLIALTCASSLDALWRSFDLDEVGAYLPKYKMVAREKIPIIIPGIQGNAMVEATWGISVKGERTVYSIGGKQALSKRPYSILVRKTRCLVPVNCLIYAIDKERPTLIRVLGERIVGLGGIYSVTKSFSGMKYEMCLFETAAPDILRSITKSIPAIFSPDKGKKWIAPSTLDEIFYRSDRTSGYWFDYFSISPDYLKKDICVAQDLQPVGLSSYELRVRGERLREIEIGKIRQNRTGK
jgi:putative SOS response-associated peptidase YedK